MRRSLPALIVLACLAGSAAACAPAPGAAASAVPPASPTQPAAAATPQPTATATVVLTTPTGPLAERGALMPWVEYEAEDGRTNGRQLGPDRAFGTISAESSGRRSVQLDKPGDYVEITAAKAANSIVVRYVIPDSEQGGGINATLSLYVGGKFRQKLNLTSKYAWSYGGEERTFNQPAAKGAHHFFDEARALVGDIPSGAAVRLEKDKDDTAGYYVIDLIDLEQVAPPEPQPSGYLSLTADCGAISDDGLDDGAAIQTCITKAQQAGTGVYIPSGTFESLNSAISVHDVTLQGAGMWYSVFHGLYARFHCTGDNCRYHDFAILGETTLRDDDAQDMGFLGGAGTGSLLDHIWVEHTKVGYWVGPEPTLGLVIRDSRFRDLFADGVNFNGASSSIVENSHFRNTGDDALTSWSKASDAQPNVNNVFRFNTVQLPWRANCFAIYGGKDNKIEDNLCADVVTYPGILLSQDFASTPFDGTTSVVRNTLTRAGGPMFRQEHGALKLRAFQGPVKGVRVSDLLIDNPTFAGIELEGSSPIGDVQFENVNIKAPGKAAILVRSNVSGSAAFTDVVVTALKSGQDALSNLAAPALFDLLRQAGNEGW